MKTGITRLLILFTTGLFHLGTAQAQESVAGIWEGVLEAAPGTEITVQFDITEADGTWSAVLNSPDMGAIKDMPATSVTVNGMDVTITVDPLSGEYQGTLTNGVIEGQWVQPGAEIAMNLSPWEEKLLSPEAIDTLAGDWIGTVNAQGTEINIVFFFEPDSEGRLNGFLQTVDAGDNRVPMSDISLEEGELTLTIPSNQIQFTGQIEGGTLTGVAKQGGQDLPVALEKGEFVATLPNLDLDDEDFDVLGGHWAGKINDTLTLVLNVERSDDGTIFLTVDSPDQGASGLKVTAANFTNDRLTVNVTAVAATFIANLVDGELVGDWTQGGRAQPLTLAKLDGPYVPTLPEQDLSDEAMALIEGTWTGDIGPLTGFIHFTRNEAGVPVASFDVPAQGAEGLPVTTVTVTGTTLEVTIAAAGATITGEIDGDTITATWVQGPENTPLVLTRVEE